MLRLASLLGLLLGGACAGGASPAHEPAPRGVELDYRLRYVPEADAALWEVTLEVRGIDPASGPVVFALEDWGGWSPLDSLLLRGLSGSPPVRPDPADPTRILLDVPADWDGRVRLAYSLALTRRGSRAHERLGLWPWQGAGFAHGFTTNTLPTVVQDGQELAATITVEFLAPAGVELDTGWTGAATGRARVELAHPLDNTPVFFGAPSGSSGSARLLGGRALRVEVAQYGRGADCTAAAEADVRALIEAYEDATGLACEDPLRVYLIDSGGGGVCVDHALVVGLDPETNGPGLNGDTRHTLAHELFHHWLGQGRLRPLEDPVWFYEGFTDYLALRQLGATGLYSPEQFLQRLFLLDRLCAGSPARGTVAFGAAEIGWRDGDGPLETLAYRGGALLAFLADVELERSGKPGIGAIVGDLVRTTGGRFRAADVRAWFDAQGLEEFAALHIDQPSPLSIDEALRAIGAAPHETPVEVAYVGLSGSGPGPFVTVEALDPAGPAARAGILPGDRVTGLWPARNGAHLSLASDLPEPYASHRYGLDFIEPGKQGTYINVLRAGEELNFPLAPELVRHGRERSFRVEDRARVDQFLRLR